jgi:cold shock CspA family protein
MEATIVNINPNYLLARNADGESIFVWKTTADFDLRDCFTGDVIQVHGLENGPRGLRAVSATWLSRPDADGLTAFAGSVTYVFHDRRRYCLVQSDDGERVFCHGTEFINADSFDELIAGDRVSGYRRWLDGDPGPRGFRLVRE